MIFASKWNDFICNKIFFIQKEEQKPFYNFIISAVYKM